MKTITVHFRGWMHWDEVVTQRIIDGIRDAIDNSEPLLFSKNDRQATILKFPTHADDDDGNNHGV